MPRFPSDIRYALAVPAAVLLATALCSTLGPAAVAQAAATGRVVDVVVHGASLEGNLEGEPADREVSIYLPPGYDDETERYPVVYLLHGYSLTNAYWVGGDEGPAGIDVAAAMDRDIASGKGRPMILVMPNADTKFDGSMYSTSVTIGDWESFVAEDLVDYVDTHYRTLANRSSRGLAGHSMGGYGTIRIGMKRPDVFSSLYVLSACCLMNDPSRFTRRAEENGNDAGRSRGRGFANVVSAEAAAWSPNPQKPPDYFDLPGDDALVAAKWAANSPLAMIDQYIPNLKRYSAIGMDVGLQDTLKDSNERLAGVLEAYGIKHSFETYEGNHVNRIAERVEDHVIPFFSEHLESQ